MRDTDPIPVELGQKLRFIPAAWPEKCSEDAKLHYDRIARDVLGVVVSIHPTHRFYRVRYEAAGTVQHECFKF